ncbi:MAG: DUF1015 family protein [Acidobacteriota bacterium]|nr:DUF1015 family protein [Blastocatellia bacterium]MDW8412059.1 DUF1015 family protein [Acidobacteriota bacterium]
MAIVRPFRALRPTPERVEQVAAVPYDVINTEEAAALAEGNPYSFLHVSRPEIDLEPGIDLYDDRVYAKAVENFAKLREICPFVEESSPVLYVYKLVMGEHSQVGVVGCCSVDEYDQDLIKKHEKTRKDKEDDRTRHTIELRAHAEPVFLTYRPVSEIDSIVESVMKSEPLFDFTAADGIRHTLWTVNEPRQLSEAFEKVPHMYVADGHHRSASASRARAVMQQQNPTHTGNEEYNYFLAVIFPSDQLRILPYNRVVKDLNERSEEEFLQELSKSFKVEPGTDSPSAKGEFAMYLNKKWYRLCPLDEIDYSNPIASLDVSILQDRLLAPLLAIQDPRTDKRIDFVGGIRGTTELIKLVDAGKAAVAFSMYPTTVDDLMRISDAGQIMPPKSTWFEPKLRSGLFIHTF